MKSMTKRKKPVFTWFTLIALVIVGLLLFWFSYPFVIRSHRNPELVNAQNNMRQLGMALIQFDNEYGSFPDAATARKMSRNANVPWKLEGNFSNDYFRQLVASGKLSDELVYYTKTAFTREPDRRIEPPEKALAAGEVGFGYLMNGRTAFNTKGNPSRPIACAPLEFEDGSVSYQSFDQTIYDGFAMLLRIDCSVQRIKIEPTTGQAMLGSNKTLLESGPDTVWGEGVTPLIVPPLPKR